MSIMDTLFGKAPAAPQPSAIPAPTAVATPGNPNLPLPLNKDGTPATPAADPSPPSPLDAHKELWQNDDTNKTAQPAPLFDIDPVKLNAAIKTADFTQSASPELMTKALAGDAAALKEVINGAAQQAFSHQTMATTKLIEQALDRRSKELEARMPELVRQASVSEQLAANPIFTNEATKPLMAALQSQLQLKFPKATASQIAEQARNYISDFAKLAVGTPVQTPEQVAASKQDDWSEFQLPANGQ